MDVTTAQNFVDGYDRGLKFYQRLNLAKIISSIIIVIFVLLFLVAMTVSDASAMIIAGLTVTGCVISAYLASRGQKNLAERYFDLTEIRLYRFPHLFDYVRFTRKHHRIDTVIPTPHLKNWPLVTANGVTFIHPTCCHNWTFPITIGSASYRNYQAELNLQFCLTGGETELEAIFISGRFNYDMDEYKKTLMTHLTEPLVGQILLQVNFPNLASAEKYFKDCFKAARPRLETPQIKLEKVRVELSPIPAPILKTELTF
ncbi:TPA: hypothetical protein DF272_00540 [Candidatus Falkowbacteria bacterium]|nr:hypothetical protein [Candidatus Falkowbacteria bacterium]